MSRTIAFVVLFTVSSLTFPASAKSDFDVAVFGGPSFKLESSFSDKKWADGWLAGVGVSYFVNENGALGVELSYHHFPYRGEAIVSPWPWDPTFTDAEEGQPSCIYEVAMTLRLIDRAWPLDSYFLVGIGLDRIHAGDAPSGYHVYAGGGRLDPGEHKTEPFLSIGIGLGVDLRPNLSFTLEGEFTQTFDRMDFRLPATVGLRYRL